MSGRERQSAAESGKCDRERLSAAECGRKRSHGSGAGREAEGFSAADAADAADTAESGRKGKAESGRERLLTLRQSVLGLRRKGRTTKKNRASVIFLIPKRT